MFTVYLILTLTLTLTCLCLCFLSSLSITKPEYCCSRVFIVSFWMLVTTGRCVHESTHFHPVSGYTDHGLYIVTLYRNGGGSVKQRRRLTQCAREVQFYSVFDSVESIHNLIYIQLCRLCLLLLFGHISPTTSGSVV